MPQTVTRALAPIVSSILSAAASAAVVAPGHELPVPSSAAIGEWSGATAVAVAPDWIVSAAHARSSLSDRFYYKGQEFVPTRIVTSRASDLVLIRLSSPLPHHHDIAPSFLTSQRVLIGGMGYTAGIPLPDGFLWQPVHQETWGENTASPTRGTLLMTFDNPASALPAEAAFAAYDSGAGVFIQDSSSNLLVAGVAVAISGSWGSTRFGDESIALDITVPHAAAFIRYVTRPGVPVASSLPPPQPSPAPVPAPAAAAFLLPLLCARTRRTQR